MKERKDDALDAKKEDILLDIVIHFIIFINKIIKKYFLKNKVIIYK